MNNEKSEKDRLIVRLRMIRDGAMLSTRERETIEEAMAMIRGLPPETPPRVLDGAELMDLPDGVVIWEEGRDGDGHETLAPVLAAGNRIGDMDCWMWAKDAPLAMLPDEDGSMFRWWTKRPTDEERRKTAWKK